jgi:hypothetical protein
MGDAALPVDEDPQNALLPRALQLHVHEFVPFAFDDSFDDVPYFIECDTHIPTGLFRLRKPNKKVG